MKDILNTYKLPELKKMVRATNITGYSKLTKDQLITLMTRPEHIDRFKSIKAKGERMGGGVGAKVNRQFKKQVKDTGARLKFELKEEAKKIEAAMDKKFGKKVVPRKIIKKETASQKRARGIAGPAEAAQEDALILLEEHRAELEKIPVMIKNEKGKRVPDPSGNNFYKNKKEKISSKSFLDGSYKMRIDRAKREVKAIKKQIEKIAAKKKTK
jgi:hypothetical protein